MKIHIDCMGDRHKQIQLYQQIKITVLDSQRQPSQII